MRISLLAVGVLCTPFLFVGLTFGQVSTAEIFAGAQGIARHGQDATPGMVLFQPNAVVGSVGVFADNIGSNCNIVPPAAGQTFRVHLVHIESEGVTGAQFYAPKPFCLNASWVADINAYPVVLGDTQTGYAVGYGSCKTGNFLICSMEYLSLGPSPDCCFYDVLPDPRLGPDADFEFSTCVFETVLGAGRAGIVNSTSACPCERDCPQPTLALQGYQTLTWQDPLWTVQVLVRNSGPGPAAHVSATMQQDIPWLGIPDPGCYYGAIPAGETSWGGTDSYVFNLTNHTGGSFNVWFDVSYEDVCGHLHLVRLDPQFDVNGEPDQSPSVETACRLEQNYPNPFNPTTTIPFFLPKDADVQLAIFDSQGKMVRELVGQSMPAGSREVVWDGRDTNGTSVSSGLYFCRLKTPDAVHTRKLLLLK
jgi:hypothetical protein